MYHIPILMEHFYTMTHIKNQCVDNSSTLYKLRVGECVDTMLNNANVLFKLLLRLLCKR